VPAARLDKHQQVMNLTGNKQKWSTAQLTLIGKIQSQIDHVADRITTRLK
jgi:chromosome partitioning protein